MNNHELAIRAAKELIELFDQRGGIEGTFNAEWMADPIERAIRVALNQKDAEELAQAIRTASLNTPLNAQMFRESTKGFKPES